MNHAQIHLAALGGLALLAAAALPATASAAYAPAQGVSLASGYTDFTTWSTYGSAIAQNNTPGNGFTYSNLVLTSPGIGNQGGAAFAPATVALDFNTSFMFDFHFFIAPGSLSGDGMTFVLTPNDPATINNGGPLVPSGGSDLGYGNSGLTGFAFAIDTFNFPGEPVAPSIQILQNGSVTPLKYTETGLASLSDPSYYQWYAKLKYTPSGNYDGKGTLTGSIDQFIGNLSFSVSATVDGNTLAGVPLHYGFTAGNGVADDGHIVTSAMPVPEPQAWAMLAAGLGLVGWRLRRVRV